MPLHPKTQIGHIHLTVSDLERSLRFYRDILGFEMTQKIGDHAAFLSAGGYHHHIALNTWGRPQVPTKTGRPGKGAPKAPSGHTGLYHFAILYPTRKELATALQALMTAKYPLDGAADHGVSEALYLHDPDGNGVELYFDRPRSEWPKDAKGNLTMLTEELDLKGLLGEVMN